MTASAGKLRRSGDLRAEVKAALGPLASPFRGMDIYREVMSAETGRSWDDFTAGVNRVKLNLIACFFVATFVTRK